MIVDESRLEAWRDLAVEPARGEMPRNRIWPSSHGKFIDQKREINLLRSALRETLMVIENELTGQGA